jgi:AcrR family transcriptional regulator
MQAIETRNKIYNTAFNLMSKKGFNNITIEDISKKAGVSVGAFYHYFKSKDDILFEVYQRADNYFRDTVKDKLKSDNSLDQIVEYFRYYARYSEQTKIGFTIHLYNTENKFFLKKGRLMQSILNDIIKEGQRKNEITKEKSSEDIVDLLFLVARGVIFDWGLNDGKYKLEEKMIELFKLQAQIYKAKDYENDASNEDSTSNESNE